MRHRTHPVLLILGSSSAEYRSYGLAEIAEDHDIYLLDDATPTWAREHLAGHQVVDLRDPLAAISAAQKIVASRPVSGVLTYMEHHVELAAKLARALGLPGLDPAAAAACRDKATSRRLLDQHGVPSARSILVDRGQAAVEAAAAIGYPAVVKPRAMAGSAGVRRVDTAEQTRAAYQKAATATVLGLDLFAASGVLVEEYLDGEEISAECVVFAPGAVHIAAIVRKRLGSEPVFEELAHTVDARDPLLRDEPLHAVVSAALNALGVTTGVVHAELRLTAQGPKIIEVNARLAGDLIPHLVRLATGVSLPQAAAALATGHKPMIVSTRKRAAAIEFYYPPDSGRIEAVYTATTLPHWMERLVWTAQPGDQVTAPPAATLDDRLAHTVVTAPDAESCRERLQQTREFLNVRITAPGRATACVS